MSGRRKDANDDGPSCRGKGIAVPQVCETKGQSDSIGGHDLPLEGKQAAVSVLRGTEGSGHLKMGPNDHFKFKLKRPEREGVESLPATKLPEGKLNEEGLDSFSSTTSQLQTLDIPIVQNDDGTTSIPNCYRLVKDPITGAPLLCVWSDENGLQDVESASSTAVIFSNEFDESSNGDIAAASTSGTMIEGSGDQNLLRQLQAASPTTSSYTSPSLSLKNPDGPSRIVSLDSDEESGDQNLQRNMQAASLKTLETTRVGCQMRRPRKDTVGNKRQLKIPSMFLPTSKRVKEASATDKNERIEHDRHGTVNDKITTSKTNSMSHVWEYFHRSKLLTKCKLCNFSMTNNYPTNARSHLRVHHTKEYHEANEKDAARPQREKRPSSQLTLVESVKEKNKYAGRNPKQQRFRQGLAWFVGCTTSSYNLTQSTEFKNLIRIADPLLSIPTRETIRNDVEKLFQKCVKAISEALSDSRKITISSDIWTKRGMRSSFLGITATFYHPGLKKKYHLVLAAKKFESVKHESKDIVREMREAIKKFQIPAAKVWAAMTDGGSNMICSHRIDMQIFAQLMEPAWRDDDEELVEAEILDASFPSFSTGVTKEVLVEGAGVLNEDYELFDMIMPTYYEHLVCIIHSTINCLNKLEDLHEVNDIVEEVKIILAKFHKSTALCQALAAETNLALINFPSTRWNYIYLTFERLVRVRSALEKVLQDANKTKYLLGSEQWERISDLISLLKPFHEKTSMASQVKAAVSSEVLPGLIELQAHVKNHQSNTFLRPVCDKLVSLLEAKFNKFSDETDPEFKGTYLAATLLDPRYRILLSEEERETSKRFILKRFKQELDFLGFDSDTVFEEDLSVPLHTSKTSFPGVADIKNEKLRKRMTPSCSQLHTFTTDLERYLQNLEYDKEPISSDPLAFWISRENEYMELAPTALDYLCVPSSTADVERLFSRGGIATQGVRNRLDGKNLEMELFLGQNRKVLEELGVSLE